MEPKIETINFAYFIPGTVLGIAIVLSMAEVAHISLEVLFKHLSVGVGAIFLGVAYVFGFAMWALADQRWRTDGIIAAWMLFYICRDRSLREEYIRLCTAAKADKIAYTIDKLSELIPDQLNLKEQKPIEYRKNDFKQTRKYVRDNPGLDRRLQMIAWDQSYHNVNQYHIGRFLSDWNNVKFAKATMASLLIGGILYLLGSTIPNRAGEFDFLKAVGVLLFFVFGLSYYWIVLWRLRAFARDLTHAHAPTHTCVEAK